ncbi:MAG: phosphate acyltransferase PlsX [Gammaproteobacteria bacterium]|nr:MAG: phosphate acyltransferase PlsX [Gammaproteobacteria bacterium]RKZ96042.1 MAG: phosphate acyltransferase PlsX [Gammaproteobacteria bacterium]RLA01635.1 MAG: phosphate acyltransferase PlsX [Gammaproteobacteria bacterium]
MSLTISIDAMGGDYGPEVVVPAAILALKAHPDIHMILVGDQDVLTDKLQQHNILDNEHFSIHHASQQVAMDESPAIALRTKKDSSMRVAINLVKDGTASACVSAGNTGALMATARFVLKTLPGIERPAIISELPTIKGHTYVLDLGANVDSSAEHMVQFAIMGSVLAELVDGIEKPTIGLLNIGSEEIKGNERVKEAARLIAETDLNYYGFVEGDGLYRGEVDVLVCDGFVGNVALKASEGVVHMIRHFLRQSFGRNIFTKLAGLIASPVLKQFRDELDPRAHNGANFIGLQGIVIKSHGGTDEIGFANAINIAVVEAEHDIPNKISKHLEVLLEGQA